MPKNDIFSVIFLCILNVIFLVAGIFLNSVVIISLWRSSQLRKKLCYFMILVLSCFDLAVVTITHPFLIVSTLYFSQDKTNEMREATRLSILYILYGCSFFALFTLNAERFLALTCPFFHQASITKTRVIYFQAIFAIIPVGLSALLHVNQSKIIANVAIAVYFPLLLFLFIYSNYKIFTIAKSKRQDERVAPTTGTTVDEKRNKQFLKLKNISTCCLVVACFFFCSCPQIIASALRLSSKTSLYDRQVLLLNLWSNTFISLNSTFNCVIFFWRNSILRREGMKIVNAFRRRVTN